MRRILIDRARRRQAVKHGGHLHRVELPDAAAEDESSPAELLALDRALTNLQKKDETKAELVKLRYFAGMTIAQAAGVLGIAPSTADKYWAYAKAWLRTEISRLSQSEEFTEPDGNS